MRLLIDLGNTRLKWAVSTGREWHTGRAMYTGRDVAELLDRAWGELSAPQAAVAASVAPAQMCRALDDWVRGRWGITVHHVQARAKQCGVVNRYRDPATLGADRWAALIGARNELPGSAACIADCGTAVTLDALSESGEFAGGVIFPGLTLLRRGLAQGTAGIGGIEGDETSCLALSTADAVAAGTLYGLAGAVERVWHEFEQAQGVPMKLLITGGDLDRVAPRLARPAYRVPDLVLKGLARIADTL